VSASPHLLRRLRELEALPDSGAQGLLRDGIVTLADLGLALAEHRPSVAHPPLARAASVLRDEQPPLTLGRAWDVLESLLPEVATHCPDIASLEPSGAVRRCEPLVEGLVLVGRASDPASAIGSFANLPSITDVLHRTGRRLVVLFQGYEIDIRLVASDDYGSVLFTTTGPAGHVADVLKRRGPRLTASEIDVYAQAGLTYLPPELRDAPDAMDLARRGNIPSLVTREAIRGDLHLHTTYSDGRDTLRDMVAAACALGHEYIAITDHSENAAASRTLTPATLARQRVEIARVREQFPQIEILHGIEADILPDGRLDCPDDIMASLDIVLASLHERVGQDGAQLTARCLQAIHHPLVSIVTHPMNQLVGRRQGYDMDYPALYAAAADTGTVLEVDGAPGHLDLDGAHARAAVAAGVTVAIDSDCHRARSLERQIRLGVGTARRGMVEPAHVLNARPVADVRAFLAAKRNR